MSRQSLLIPLSGAALLTFSCPPDLSPSQLVPLHLQATCSHRKLKTLGESAKPDSYRMAPSQGRQRLQALGPLLRPSASPRVKGSSLSWMRGGEGGWTRRKCVVVARQPAAGEPRAHAGQPSAWAPGSTPPSGPMTTLSWDMGAPQRASNTPSLEVRKLRHWWGC